jgi:hypothetical protein
MSRSKEQRFPVAGKERGKDIFNLFLLILWALTFSGVVKEK